MWCHLLEGEYNTAKDGCNPDSNADFDDWLSAWGHCLPSGILPDDGGLPMPYNREVLDTVPDDFTNVCTDNKQKCIDPSSATDEDWICECIQPSTGPPGQQAPTTCVLDECEQHGVICAGAAPPQECNDPDKSPDVTSDWTCTCTVGAVVSEVAGPVELCELDECVHMCDTCAFDGVTTPCGTENQNCVDPVNNTDSTGDWFCECPTPYTGTQLRGVAECVLDECSTECDHCALRDGTMQDVCAAAGQVCTDELKGRGETENWVCSCPPPSLSTATYAAVPACELDECALGEGVMCEGSDQKCTDKDLTLPDTWYCECKDPHHGVQDLGLAVCTLDECADNGVTCTDAGQECEDQNHQEMDTWYCKCGPTETGEDGHMMPAECVRMGACSVEQNAQVCIAAGQRCFDDVTSSAGNWVCQCIVGTGEDAVMMRTSCTLDECTEVCASCEQTTATDAEKCEAHGQTCVDEDKDAADAGLNNWVCRCKMPAIGEDAVKAEATCTIDQCEATCEAPVVCEEDLCSNEGQVCEDPDTSEKVLGDWVCKCADDPTARATMAVFPLCGVHNECDDPIPHETCANAVP
jgi:hypothetical protein